MTQVFVMDGTVIEHKTKKYVYYALYLSKRKFLEQLKGKKVYVILIVPEEGED